MHMGPTASPGTEQPFLIEELALALDIEGLARVAGLA